MPGPSQVLSMAAMRNIDVAMTSIFKESQLLNDANRVKDLMEKAHIWEDRLLQNHIMLMRFMFWVLSVFIVISSLVIPFIKPVENVWMAVLLWLIPILTVLESRWSERRRRDALKELELLKRSNPTHWEPLIIRVKQVVVNYGKVESSFSGNHQIVRLNESGP